MANTVTLAYTAEAVNVTAARLAPLVAGPLVHPDVLIALGCRVTADATPVAAPVVRTITISFIPSVNADATLTLRSDGSISAIAVGVRGNDYIRPPRVVPSGSPNGVGAILKAFLRVNAVQIAPPPPPISGGAGYTAATEVTFMGGLPPAEVLSTTRLGCVRRVYVKTQGLGYPAGTTCIIEGGGINSTTPAIPARAIPTIDAFGRITDLQLIDMGVGYIQPPKVTFLVPGGVGPTHKAEAFCAMAEGTPARAGIITIALGVITNIAIADPGAGYIQPPLVLIRDVVPGGAGAVGRARMEVDRIDVLRQGIGYTAITTAFTPFFKTMFPDGPTQARPWFRFMQTAIKLAARTPVTSAVPVLA